MSDKTKLPYGRLTFDGNFCDIAKCREERWGKYCPDGACSQRKVWERLKEYEDALSLGIAYGQSDISAHFLPPERGSAAVPL